MARVNTPIKLYVDKSYIPEGWAYPFWSSGETSLFGKGIFDEYYKRAAECFDLVSVEDCDYIFWPFSWPAEGYQEELVEMQKLAQEKGKRLLIFILSDSEDPVELEDAVVFRTSILGCQQRPYEFAVPGFHADYIKDYFKGELQIRNKEKMPRVGFCGDAFYVENTRGLKGRLYAAYYKVRFKLIGNPKIFKFLAKLGLPLTKRLGTKLRTQGLTFLAKSPLVRSQFVYRGQYFNGLTELESEKGQKHFLDSRKEFIENIINSDYVFCARGQGNFSVRFYETLCCGRIPVFVNSDCVLPYEKEIDWKKYCVWVEEDEIDHIAEKVAEFHEKINPEAFIGLQQECRNLWKELLSPEGFFGNLGRNLD